MGAEHLGHCPHDMVTLAVVPEQGAIPEVPDESVDGPGGPAEQLCGSGQVDRVTADDERLENLQMSPIEPVQGPLNAGSCAGTSGQ
jgi:hypothetical protein